MPTLNTPAPPLVEKARTAHAPFGHGGKWASLLPAAHILIARGFSLTDAVEWLVTNKAIRAEDRRAVYFSIAQRFRRAGISIRKLAEPELTEIPEPELLPDLEPALAPELEAAPAPELEAAPTPAPAPEEPKALRRRRRASNKDTTQATLNTRRRKGSRKAT